MVEKDVLAKLIDRKKEAVLRVILHSSEELYLQEIAKKSKVSTTSTFRILQEMVSLGVLTKKQWKTSKTYSCLTNPKTEFLKNLFHEDFDGLQAFIDSVKGTKGISTIILHGAKKKNKANVLIIGNGIDLDPLDKIAQEIKEKGFEVSFLTLTKEQYEQMSKMGLYSGDKTTLL
ncbi:MAG: helix-turn-helix domain-containing protein [archaeon]|nr:helix-turn-helix domain-containing protein [archaeon]